MNFARLRSARGKSFLLIILNLPTVLFFLVILLDLLLLLLFLLVFRLLTRLARVFLSFLLLFLLIRSFGVACRTTETNARQSLKSESETKTRKKTRTSRANRIELHSFSSVQFTTDEQTYPASDAAWASLAPSSLGKYPVSSTVPPARIPPGNPKPTPLHPPSAVPARYGTPSPSQFVAHRPTRRLQAAKTSTLQRQRASSYRVRLAKFRVVASPASTSSTSSSSSPSSSSSGSSARRRRVRRRRRVLPTWASQSVSQSVS